MKAYFADTSYYISLLFQRDRTHALAQQVSAKLSGDIVTSDFVVLELAAFFARPPERVAFCQRLDEIRREPHVTIVPADRALMDRGWHLYAQHADKGWSLTDCISFVIMQDRQINEALTTDRHFEQAGFVALLKGPAT
jgi:predicted nucleic acid-binding protein